VIFIPGLHRLFQVQSMPVVSLLQVAVLAFIPTLMIQMKRLICKKWCAKTIVNTEQIYRKCKNL